MSDIEVEPDKSGLKLRCAQLSVLLALKQEGPLQEEKLKQEASKRNYDSCLIFGSTSSSSLQPRRFETILLSSINRGYIDSTNEKYKITEDGCNRVDNLLKDTVDRIR